jgi:hypothetical protein
LLTPFNDTNNVISSIYIINLMAAAEVAPTGAGHLGDGSLPINKRIMQK